MKERLRRLFYRPDGERINYLTQLFLYQTFLFGIAFVFFPHDDSVKQSILFDATRHNLGDNFILTWGSVALVVSVVNALGVMWAKFWVVATAAMGGFILWLYALGLYAFTDHAFQFFATIPQVAFWAYYYVKVYTFKPER